MTQRDREWFVEQVGAAAEADGFTRIGGRIFGHLLLSEEPCSLDELVAELGASKASVSTDARRLLASGVVEKVPVPGDRRDYYRLAPDFFARLTEHRVRRWGRLHDLVGEARRRLPDAPPAVRDRFAYMDDVHAFVFGRLQGALTDWARHVASRRRGRA